MSKFNPQFDEYIAKSADFAKPILTHLRQLIHYTCPEAEEVIKWGNPHFDYKGDMMCILTAHKQHCSFSFWKAELMSDPKMQESVKSGQAMGYMVPIANGKTADTRNKNIEKAMQVLLDSK